MTYFSNRLRTIPFLLHHSQTTFESIESFVNYFFFLNLGWMILGLPNRSRMNHFSKLIANGFVFKSCTNDLFYQIVCEPFHPCQIIREWLISSNYLWTTLFLSFVNESFRKIGREWLLNLLNHSWTILFFKSCVNDSKSFANL